MLNEGPALKVAIYVSEAQHYHGNIAYRAILDYLFHHAVAGATIIRGIAGFGAEHHLHTDDILRMSSGLPVKIEFVETPERVQELLPKLRQMAGGGMIEWQQVHVAQPPLAPGAASRQPVPPQLRLEGRAKLMRIYVSENDRWRDKPLHEAIVEALRGRCCRRTIGRSCSRWWTRKRNCAPSCRHSTA